MDGGGGVIYKAEPYPGILGEALLQMTDMLYALFWRQQNAVGPQLDRPGVQVFHQAGLEQYDIQVAVAHPLFPGVGEHLVRCRSRRGPHAA